MTSIERTAYPRFTTRKLKQSLLEELYTPKEDELYFVLTCLHPAKGEAKKDVTYNQNHLNMLVLLKTYQKLSYFPKLATIPHQIINHIRTKINLPTTVSCRYKTLKTMYRYQKIIRSYLKTRVYDKSGKQLAEQTAFDAAQIHNYPADIINTVIETLVNNRYELPAFIQLNRLVKNIRHQANQALFNKVCERLGKSMCAKLNELIKPANRTDYNKLKHQPKNVTLTHFKDLLAHHEWLLALGSMDKALKDVAPLKQSHFAGEAKSLDASDLRKFSPTKRYALIACLIRQTQQQTKDSLAIMFIKTMNKIEKRAKNRLEERRKQHKEKTYNLINLFNEVVIAFQSKGLKKKCNAIEEKLKNYGGPVAVLQECEGLLACYTDNHLPFIWPCFSSSRPTLFWLLKSLNLQSSNQDVSLLKAQDFILANAHKRKPLLPFNNLNISFASPDWQKLIIKKEGKKNYIVRRQLEVCVLTYLAKELHATNLWVPGSASFTNFRQQLVPWQECEPLVLPYCEKLSIPTTGTSATAFLKETLNKKAKEIDDQYPSINELIINEQGILTLKRARKLEDNPRIAELAYKIRALMPERNLIDILSNAHHYTGWAYEFGPLSGSEPKLANAVERYIMATFAYGTSMGPTQASQHMRGDISAHMLSWINRRHTSIKMQEKALVRLINYYCLFDLTQNWGTGKAAIADGTLRSTYEENLLAEYHVRYQAKGGIAYHHIADSYIALFSTFMPCGLWEAVEILDGLLKNHSDIQPFIIHADTQGQSTIVFGLAFLLGIQLMPRIRNWKDLKFFSSEPKVNYQNISGLFKDHINWQLIENHWEDMLQVVLSIRDGKISSSVLLRKLTSYSRKNKFYQAFQELGRIVRTLFLLDYISDKQMREEINSQTNKIEAYNGFAAWLSFGNPYTLVASNDPEEQEKAVKYTDILANSVMLQNTIDISNVVIQLVKEGSLIAREDLKYISPLLTGHIKRFGDYVVDLSIKPQDANKSLKLPL